MWIPPFTRALKPNSPEPTMGQPSPGIRNVTAPQVVGSMLGLFAPVMYSSNSMVTAPVATKAMFRSLKNEPSDASSRKLLLVAPPGWPTSVLELPT